MIKEQIKEAAIEWSSTAFIESVWHEPEEKPELGKHIIVQLGCGNFTSWHAVEGIDKEFKKFSVKHWAYTDDILPAKG